MKIWMKKGWKNQGITLIALVYDKYNINITKLDGLKLEELIRKNSETSLEVNLKSKNIFSKPAICYANTLILNADTNLRKKIITILQES